MSQYNIHRKKNVSKLQDRKTMKKTRKYKSQRKSNITTNKSKGANKNIKKIKLNNNLQKN